MKKILNVLFVFCFFLVGCKSENKNQEEINFGKTELLEEERYEYEHGVADYQFEKWSFDGDALSFDYNISNIGKECEFGLVFLVDGLYQDYEVNGETTSMYTLNMKSNEQKKLSIKLSPKIDSNKEECNLNAFLILNPSMHINDLKQYGHNHSISSMGTICLKMNKSSIDPNIGIKNVKVEYQEIPSQIIDNHTKDGINMLDSNVYIEKNSSDDDQNYLYVNQSLQLKAYGKQGNYRILEFTNNHVTNMYNVSLRKNQYANIILKSSFEKNDNVYFLIVPLDIQDPYDYIMMNQSERWIVK